MPEKLSKKERQARAQQAKADALQPLLEKLTGSDPEERLAAVREVREALNGAQPPSVDIVLQAGLVPELLRAAVEHDHRSLQFEALWVLTDLTKGTAEQVTATLDAGCLGPLKLLLAAPQPAAREQACMILAQAAAASVALRDRLLVGGVAADVMRVLHGGKDVEQRTCYDEGAKVWRLQPGSQGAVSEGVARAASRCLAALCAGEPRPEWAEAMLPLMHTLEVLVMSQDEQVIACACQSLCCLDFQRPAHVGMVVKFGICSHLVELLGHASPAVRALAANAAEGVARGSKHGMMAILLCEPADSLKDMLLSEEPSDHRAGCSLLTAVLEVGGPHVKEVVDAGCVPPLFLLLLNGEDSEARRGAARAIGTLTARCPPSKVRELMPTDVVCPMVQTLEAAAFASGLHAARAAVAFVEGLLRTDRQLGSDSFVQSLRRASASAALRHLTEVCTDKELCTRAQSFADVLDTWETQTAGAEARLPTTCSGSGQLAAGTSASASATA